MSALNSTVRKVIHQAQPSVMLLTWLGSYSKCQGFLCNMISYFCIFLPTDLPSFLIGILLYGGGGGFIICSFHWESHLLSQCLRGRDWRSRSSWSAWAGAKDQTQSLVHAVQMLSSLSNFPSLCPCHNLQSIPC